MLRNQEELTDLARGVVKSCVRAAKCADKERHPEDVPPNLDGLFGVCTARSPELEILLGINKPNKKAKARGKEKKCGPRVCTLSS